MSYTIDELLEAWHLAALNEWERIVRDENGSDTIEAYFRTIGWPGYVGGGYRNAAKYAWCGIFSAVMGLRVGSFLQNGVCLPVALDYDVAKFAFPSTERLASPHKWSAAGVRPPRILKPLPNQLNGSLAIDDLKPGMTCTIAARDYGDRRNDYGGHVVIVDRVHREARLVDTIEGNAWGELGHGEWGEGVVRRRGSKARNFEDFRRALVLDAEEHFDNMAPGAEAA